MTGSIQNYLENRLCHRVRPVKDVVALAPGVWFP